MGALDYGALGYAVQMRIALDAGDAEAQFAALVQGFFALSP